MPALPTNLRRDLERTVIKAREVAEAGAQEALEALTIHEAKPGGHLDVAGRALRNRLRAHARQLGDRRDTKTDRQAIDRLVHECAYEHWHRMLFARFLAENDLLLEPESGVSLNLDLARDLARETKRDVWEMISRFATDTLPQIFRPDDPVLAVELAPEIRLELEKLLEELPSETFLAEDSLGWVYQFWQTNEKKRVNASGEKITGDTLPAVTQLFTEHYMVEFLLHNTLGAWHAGKILATEDTEGTETEEELRKKVAVRTAAGVIEWAYLRFVSDPPPLTPPRQGEGLGEGGNSANPKAEIRNQKSDWRPAAGVFAGWPRDAKDLKILDPCCGSGHFLVAALQLLVRLRMHEEGLSTEEAVCAVIRDNLFGLEIDQRCVQLAAFNVALAAWTLVRRRIELPELHIACSGIGPSASEEEWIKLAEESGKPFPRGGAEPIRDGLRNLHSQFNKASTLGSLIDPGDLSADLITADYETLKPYLDAAFIAERSDDVRERAITAAGMVKAAELLVGDYTLVITNVPYLGRGKQDSILQSWAEVNEPSAKADLATIFVSRCSKWLSRGGSAAVVSPQNWLTQTSYTDFRRGLLTRLTLHSVTVLGEEAWQAFGIRGPKATLVSFSAATPSRDSLFWTNDVAGLMTIEEKTIALFDRGGKYVSQRGQLAAPDHRLTLVETSSSHLLSEYADSLQGISTTDNPRFVAQFWEILHLAGWVPLQGATSATVPYGGKEVLIRIDELEQNAREIGAAIRGRLAWGRSYVAIRQLRDLFCTLSPGFHFDTSVAAIVPMADEHLGAIYAFCESRDFTARVRELETKNNVTNGTLVKVPFDLARWQRVAAEKYPNGLPEPESHDPTQWLFHGCPDEAERGTELQVAVARMLGYRWPAEQEAEMRLSTRARELVARCEGLVSLTDSDGIVCLTALRGESPAGDRLRDLLRVAFGSGWSTGRERQLLDAAECPGISLDDWLRTKFFEQHCNLFHDRPFMWQIWDGNRDGFHALVNYHKLAAPDGAGRRLLDKLTHVYLRDWIIAQTGAVARGEPGAEARLAAAETLKSELEKILEGEPPYDLFVRWKPLHEQAIGWNPDINDGVRLNIRPFMMAKDVGRKGAGILRFKPNIKWGPKADKGNDRQSLRPREDFPWFWVWNGKVQDFAGSSTFDGKRWNNLHYTNAFKQTRRT